MRKIINLLLLSLLITSQLFAQKQQSFAEYHFGITPEMRELRELKSVQVKPVVHRTKKAPKGNENGIITLDLQSPVNPTSFVVNEKGVWVETYNDEDYTFFEVNAPFAFSHIPEGMGASFGGFYWDGFTYSKNGDNSDQGGGGSMGWVENQWGNMAGGGIATDTEGNVLRDEQGVVLTDAEIPYLIAFWGFHMEPEYFHNHFGSLTEPMHNLQAIFNDGKTYEPVGLYINSHPWPYYGVMNGDGFARAFDQEGDHLKVIIHGLDGDLNETGKSVEHILAEYKDGELIQSPNWEWVDLSDLDEVGGIYFTLVTTDADPMWGPNTAMFFCMDKLQIKDPDISTATGSLQDRAFQIYPNPFTDYIFVERESAGDVAIYDLAGRVVLKQQVAAGKNRIAVTALPKGTYIVQCGDLTQRIFK